MVGGDDPHCFGVRARMAIGRADMQLGMSSLADAGSSQARPKARPAWPRRRRHRWRIPLLSRAKARHRKLRHERFGQSSERGALLDQLKLRLADFEETGSASRRTQRARTGIFRRSRSEPAWSKRASRIVMVHDDPSGPDGFRDNLPGKMHHRRCWRLNSDFRRFQIWVRCAASAQCGRRAKSGGGACRGGRGRRYVG